MSLDGTTTILTDDELDYIPMQLPETREVYFKVLKADEKTNRAVLKVKFGPGATMPRHYHHCRAFAYTISGEWRYDKGSFRAGDVAYEAVGEEHTPSSKTGAEMMIQFDADSSKFLENFLSDGTVITLGMKFLKAFERISLAAAAKLDPTRLVEIRPAAAAE